MAFVKSADTATSVEKSRADLNRILQRYGCTAFGYEQREDGTTRVTFRIPDSPGSLNRVPVQLEVRPRDVYARLYPGTKSTSGHYVARRWVRAGAFDPKGLEQAERVAWRHLLLWVDAACTAAASGLTTIEEAFFAHRLIVDEAGRTGRVFDFVRSLTDGEAPGTPKLIGAGT